MTSRSKIVLIALAAFGIGAGLAIALIPGGVDKLSMPRVLSTGQATVGGPFSLIDHTGKAVTDRDFRGRHMLVFFGFRNCPDICPTALQVMSAALEKLGPKAENVTPIFISVDPERDTPTQLSEYIESFHPKLVGLTGTPEQVAAAAKAYRVYFKKVKTENSDDYSMDHTSIVYLMDRNGLFVTHFTHATPLETFVARLAKEL